MPVKNLLKSQKKKKIVFLLLECNLDNFWIFALCFVLEQRNSFVNRINFCLSYQLKLFGCSSLTIHCLTDGFNVREYTTSSRHDLVMDSTFGGWSKYLQVMSFEFFLYKLKPLKEFQVEFLITFSLHFSFGQFREKDSVSWIFCFFLFYHINLQFCLFLICYCNLLAC